MKNLFKKDKDYFFLVETTNAEAGLFNESVYQFIVDYCKKENKKVSFSQTFVKTIGASLLMGTNSLREDYSIPLNAFIFEVYARIKDGTPVTTDFPLKAVKVGETQIEIYTIDNLKTF